MVEDSKLFYRTVLAEPAFLMPIVYTPTVGEACQKFGQLPLLPRGCPSAPYAPVSGRFRGFSSVFGAFSEATWG